MQIKAVFMTPNERDRIGCQISITHCRVPCSNAEGLLSTTLSLIYLLTYKTMKTDVTERKNVRTPEPPIFSLIVIFTIRLFVP